jgi:predicted AAA+ superfamily ATPase
VYLSLSQNPALLRDLARRIAASGQPVIIDEIQKLPSLLDEVHNLIETEGLHFILTGSSGRKLKRSGVNLLAGRAWQCNLFPLCSAEIPNFDLERYLLTGGLPQVYDSQWPQEELDAYINTYLKEEIKEEALVQNFTAFTRFLKLAALGNAEQLNFANVSQDTGIPASTVRSYFEILSDTFTGFLLEPWRASRKRKAISTAKFYFFDIGVANFLAGTHTLNRDSTEFGKAFEHFIAMELRAWLSYRRIKQELCFWRTHTGVEVDFVIGDSLAIEAKSTAKLADKHLKGLRALAEEGVIKTLIMVSFDELDRTTADGIQLLHWRSFLERLWAGRIDG